MGQAMLKVFVDAWEKRIGTQPLSRRERCIGSAARMVKVNLDTFSPIPSANTDDYLTRPSAQIQRIWPVVSRYFSFRGLSSNAR